MLSPVELEQKINQFEEGLSSQLAKRRWVIPLSFFFIGAYLWWAFALWTKPMPSWSRFFIAQDRLYAQMTLLVGFYVSFIMPIHWRKYLFPLLMICSWLVPVAVLKIDRPIVFAPVVFLFINALTLRRSRVGMISKFAAASFAVLSFGILVWLIGRDAEISKTYDLFRYFWTLHVEMLLLYFLSAAFRSEPVSFEQSLNPVQLVLPLPWPKNLSLLPKSKDLEVLRMSGLLRAAYGQAVFVVLLLVIPRMPIPAPEANNPRHYLSFIFFVSACFATVTGFLRMFGYNAPPASYFLLLAKSPLEIWQRGSTYMAQFLFNNVFLPTWLRSRKMWLASVVLIVVVFFDLYLFHELFLRELLRWLAPTLPIRSGTTQQIFLLPLLWMCSWLLWIATFFGLTKVWPFLKTDTGAWVAIVLTHLGCSQMYWLARLMAKALGTSLD
jgi:hypothetical protein